MKTAYVVAAVHGLRWQVDDSTLTRTIDWPHSLTVEKQHFLPAGISDVTLNKSWKPRSCNDRSIILSLQLYTWSHPIWQQRVSKLTAAFLAMLNLLDSCFGLFAGNHSLTMFPCFTIMATWQGNPDLNASTIYSLEPARKDSTYLIRNSHAKKIIAEKIDGASFHTVAVCCHWISHWDIQARDFKHWSSISAGSFLAVFTNANPSHASSALCHTEFRLMHVLLRQ